MNIQYIITQALVEYDKRKPTIDLLLKKKNKIAIRKGREDTERDVITIHDKNNNIIVESEYEILGSYYPAINIWTWAWANAGFYPPQNNMSKDILNHAISWGKDRAYLKSVLINSRTIITDKIQLDVNLAVSSSIIKHYYIYPYIYKTKDTEMIHYLILLNDSKLDSLIST